MKKLISLLLSLMLVATLITACGEKKVEEPVTSTEKETKTETETKGEKVKFAIIVKNTGNPYNEKEMEGFVKAIEELGGEVILKAPDQPTAEAQIQMIEELIAQNVAAIAIAANDPDALQPALQKAMDKGIKVLSLDSAVNADSRMVHVNQADPTAIGTSLVAGISEMMGGTGQFAILSATSQATNQNAWIEVMKDDLVNYPDIELVKVAYGDDLRDKSVSETEALLQSYPNLKGIVAPTTVGVAAAGKVLTDKGLKGTVQLTGLGLPSEMAEYIESGVCEWMYLWNPIDVGYLAGYAAAALVDGTITGAEGDKFKAGTLGEKSIITVGDGTEIMLGDPFKFDAGNIGEWKAVY
ncbi:MAG: rhamnose ABC transporter substrate-binding protein [Firmicutes bacterium HGW-Firmicutes-7]|nr:MAG: rhamnose ABC transporter substrate-binding protein [Firmicutes bacterium HGW-Firmicutes-7]